MTNNKNKKKKPQVKRKMPIMVYINKSTNGWLYDNNPIHPPLLPFKQKRKIKDSFKLHQRHTIT